MSEQWKGFGVSRAESQKQAREIIEKLLAVAEPGIVFGEPVQVGEHTIITASEITLGLGFGSGGGFGRASKPTQAEEDGGEVPSSGGYGAGGGGGAGSRPVAAIIAGPDRILVEPILDATKLGLAFLTTVGGMFLAFNKMRKASRS
jgi:uncharacterized spore protein YtfJ